MGRTEDQAAGGEGGLQGGFVFPFQLEEHLASRRS